MDFQATAERGGTRLCVRSAPARSLGLGLSILEEGLTVRADPLGLLGARPSDQLGVVDPTVAAQMRRDGEIIYGANRGSLLRHLTRMLPHAKFSLVSRGLEQGAGRAGYGQQINHNLMRVGVNCFAPSR